MSTTPDPFIQSSLTTLRMIASIAKVHASAFAEGEALDPFYLGRAAEIAESFRAIAEALAPSSAETSSLAEELYDIQQELQADFVNGREPDPEALLRYHTLLKRRGPLAP